MRWSVTSCSDERLPSPNLVLTSSLSESGHAMYCVGSYQGDGLDRVSRAWSVGATVKLNTSVEDKFVRTRDADLPVLTMSQSSDQ